jgi:signal-transduction protein with cAMP-binding, CBS, and nucleotidyltransferase domain
MTSVKQIERIFKRDGKVLMIGPQASIDTAAKIMCDHRVGCLVVVDGKRQLLGIVTERDIIRGIVAKSISPKATKVEQIMTRHVVSCALDTTVAKAQKMMAEHGIRHLPIVEDGIPVGMISSRDVLAHQLSATRTIATQQLRTLQDLEEAHPGITALKKDAGGRVILDDPEWMQSSA